MISFKELNEQNEKITELSQVLSLLIMDRAICDTDTTCDLFFDYIDKVKAHLDVEERELYRELLTHSDAEIKNTANKFLSGSGEIKRVFKQYVKKWCRNKQLRIKNHDQFIAETNDMFDMVLDRIVNETEHFYPVVRDVYGQKMAA